ncbi:MAG: hypothetical protein KF713_16450 [Turneriella sp.]|nr:hypothetical protein [Turneriella sp.]
MRKWIWRAVLALLLLLVIGVAGLVVFIRKNYSPEKVKAELESTLMHKTGLAVTIGQLEFTWAGDIRLRQICIRNPAMRSERCLVFANITSLDLRILPLLKKRIEIRAAHLEDMAVNLFTEEKPAEARKREILKSWDIPLKEPAAGVGGGAELKLDALKISNGIILHEARALPLPMGKTKFKLVFSEGLEKTVKLEAEYPDGGMTSLNLKVHAENMLTSVKSLLREGKAAESDKIAGELVCKTCNGSALDPRLATVSGNFELAGAQNRIQIAANRAEIGVQGPLIAVFTYSGKLTLLLPALAVEAGSGSLSAAGISLVYSNMSLTQTMGLKADFDATLDFGSFRGMPGLPPHLKGVATAHGQFEKGIAAGQARVRNFELPLSAGLSLASPDFSAGFINSTLTLVNQGFTLNKNAFSATGKVAGNEVNLKVSAPVLTYEKWRVDSFTGDVRKSGAILQVNNATMVFARGRLTANYSRQLATHAQSLRLSAAGLKAQELSPLFGFKTTVFGDVSADVNVSFAGDSAAEMMKRLSGTAALRLGRGKIKDTFMQKGVLGGPLHKLEEKFSDIEFASGSADISFNGGRFQARKVFFDAEEWNITLRAEADNDGNGKAALDFRFRPSFVENVANPLHLGIEGRKEGDFYELPFACRGNVFSGACYKQNW